MYASLLGQEEGDAGPTTGMEPIRILRKRRGERATSAFTGYLKL